MFKNAGLKLIIALLGAVAQTIFLRFIENDMIFTVFAGALLFMMLLAYSYIEGKK